MTKSKLVFAASAFALAAGLMLPVATPALALTMQECSAKYNAAKTGNALNGASWNDFRKSQCGETAAPVAAPVAPAPAATAPKTQPAVTTAGVRFPRAVDSKYAAEKESKQRMKTCLDQYNVNKTNGGNGELKWIMKGGGYYSQCNAKLKGTQGA